MSLNARVTRLIGLYYTELVGNANFFKLIPHLPTIYKNTLYFKAFFWYTITIFLTIYG